MNFAIVINMVLAIISLIVDAGTGVTFHMGMAPMGMAIMGQLILLERGINEKR